MDEALRKQLSEFTDFLNEPPSYEDRRMVRDYRHEAYRKWEPLCRALVERLTVGQSVEPEVGGKCSD